jgi:hypothetical protein
VVNPCSLPCVEGQAGHICLPTRVVCQEILLSRQPEHAEHFSDR